MYVTIQDVKIRYEVLDGNKENVILFVHGFGVYANSYRNMLEHINSFGFKVYTLDLYGHGLSEGARGTANVEFNIQTVIDFRKKVVHEKNVVLIGHSMGGLTVGRVIQTDSFKYKGAIMLSPMIRSGEWLVKQSGFDLTLLPETALSIMDSILQSVAKFQVIQIPVDFTTITETTTELFTESALKDSLVPSVVPMRYLLNSFKEAKAFINHVNDIDVPVHIIFGEKDKLTSPKIKFIIQDNPKIAYSLIGKGGHELHHEVPDIVNHFFEEIIKVLSKM